MINKITKLSIIIGLICCNQIIAQVRLVNFEVSKCFTDIQLNESNLLNSITNTNDSVIEIQTKIIFNCIGVHNPKIFIYGPIVNIEFLPFVVDSNNFSNPNLTYDCICAYHVKWNISGISVDSCSKLVFLINGQIFDNYDKKHLGKSLISYELDNRRLINVVDMNNKKQWRHEQRIQGNPIIKFYLNDELIK